MGIQVTEPVDLTGVHFVRTKRGPLGSRWQVYAWRGGPRILTADQLVKPRLTAEALGKLVDARRAPATKPRGDTFPALADAYLSSPEYLLNDAGKPRSPYTKRDYRMWAERAKAEFAGAKVAWFDDPTFRADIIAWRDKWAHSPRMADNALSVLSIVLSWGAERGWLATDPCKLISRKYRAGQRADIVWTDEEVEAVAAKMRPHLARAFRLIAWTGLPRSDIVALRWAEVGDLFISRERNKTSAGQVIPLFDQSRALLDEFRAYARGRKIQSLFVVTTRGGKQMTPEGFATAVHRAHKAAGVAAGKTLHDLRGTFATRLMDAEFTDPEIDEVLGWEGGTSGRIRRTYISRRNVVLSAIARMRERTAREPKL